MTHEQQQALLGAWYGIVGSDNAFQPSGSALTSKLPKKPTKPEIPTYGVEGYNLKRAAPELTAALYAGKVKPQALVVDVVATVETDVEDGRRLWTWVALLQSEKQPYALIHAWDSSPDDIFTSLFQRFNNGPKARREVLPLHSGVAILPGQSVQVTARPQRVAFRPERFHVSSAGTPGGAGDWTIQDIRIGNRSQFSQAGNIPGDMFTTNAIDAFVSFETCQTAMDVTVIATYNGPNEDGAHFLASLTGTAVFDNPPEVPIFYGDSLEAILAHAPGIALADLKRHLGMAA